jgi:hypothetical protein
LAVGLRLGFFLDGMRPRMLVDGGQKIGFEDPADPVNVRVLKSGKLVLSSKSQGSIITLLLWN